MSTLLKSGDFRSIVINHTPLIDVRSPIEFTKGAFPYSVNLPLMSDEERHQVGICYKEQGNKKAIELGHQLVRGQDREDRIDRWRDFIADHPDAKLYCFRGGERSKISQEWLSHRGIDIIRLDGGYKAFREYLIGILENSNELFNPIILGGRTGSGKTALLQEIDNMIDLEALANHRGSSFGRYITPQPTQIDFENALAYRLLEKIELGMNHILFEDEGRNIGQSYLPSRFAKYLSQAPLIVLEIDIQDRVDITFEEYVVSAQKLYMDSGVDDPISEWSRDIKSAMRRIERRLGGLRYKKLIDIFTDAIEIQKSSDMLDAHRAWVEYLLREYYDPMYDYQIEKRSGQILFRGDREEVLEYVSKFRIFDPKSR